jgi:hypothetical protein
VVHTISPARQNPFFIPFPSPLLLTSLYSRNVTFMNENKGAVVGDFCA